MSDLGTPRTETHSNSNKKGRHLLSPSPDSIRRELDNKALPYRHGWPTLRPLPLTSHRQGAHTSVDSAQAHLKEAQEILLANDIYSCNLSFMFRVHEDVKFSRIEDEDQQEYLTLLILLDSLESIPRSKLEDGLVALREYTKQHEATAGLYIEVLDIRAHDDGIRTFPIRAGANFEGLCAARRLVWDILGEEGGKDGDNVQWSAMDILCRGIDRDENKAVPTICITSPDADREVWWSVIMPRMRKEVAQVAEGFHVELLHGDVSRGSG